MANKVNQKPFGKRTLHTARPVGRNLRSDMDAFRVAKTKKYSSSSIDIPLLAQVVGLLVGGSTVMILELSGWPRSSFSGTPEVCVNTNNNVVPDKCCEPGVPDVVACPTDQYPFRWYYGGQSSGHGSYAHGGSYVRSSNSSYYRPNSISSTSRGIFGGHGSFFSGGS